MADRIEIRIKIENNEIELRGESDSVREFLEILLPLIKSEISVGDKIIEKPISAEPLPPIQISDKEPVSEIILKLFSTSWAKKPRSLSEVINALTSLGLYFQKSTIAVNLKRLVQRGKLRRIRDKDGIFLYVPIIPPEE